jgi:phosphatidylserine decarboxylase
MLLNYEDHKNLKDIEKLLKKPVNGGKDNERSILNKLKSLRYKELDNKIITKILNHFVESDEDFINDPKWGLNAEYTFDASKFLINLKKSKLSFMDFFTRKLNQKLHIQIGENAKKCNMIIPNECYIESIGNFNKEGRPENKILRLKKSSGKYATEDLKKLNIDVEGYNYINMKLLVTFYHRIHCPISGKITQMIPIEGKDDFFGKNTLWIIKFETEKSPVYLMLVGESTIQDFDFLKEKEDNVNIYDYLGYFNWGSQTVILYNPKDFSELEIEAKKKYFVGDCIFK